MNTKPQDRRITVEFTFEELAVLRSLCNVASERAEEHLLEIKEGAFPKKLEKQIKANKTYWKECKEHASKWAIKLSHWAKQAT